MGNFRIVVNAIGGHGDKRNLKDGEKNWGCMSMTCPDCLSREFVELLKRRGVTIESAILEHWPAVSEPIAGATCSYAGVRHYFDGTTQVYEPVGQHRDACGLGAKGGPIIDDLLTGIRTGSFGNS